MPGGFPGEDLAASNPLWRATSRLFETGKPFPRLCMCFFKSPSDELKWLGVFVHTAGEKISFFPGFADSYSGVLGFREKKQVWNQAFDFDHLTLEPTLKTWHATSSRSQEHLGKPRTLDLGESRVLWFGMSVVNEHILRPVRNQTRLRVYIPRSDARRRLDAFIAARDGARFPIVELNDEYSVSFDPAFLHFAVIAGPKGFSDYQAPDLGFPFDSPFLATKLQGDIGPLPLRSHRVELSESIDLQIVSCKLPGQAMLPVSFTSPFARQR